MRGRDGEGCGRVRKAEDAEAEQLACSSCSCGRQAPDGSGRAKGLAAGVLHNRQGQPGVQAHLAHPRRCSRTAAGLPLSCAPQALQAFSIALIGLLHKVLVNEDPRDAAIKECHTSAGAPPVTRVHRGCLCVQTVTCQVDPALLSCTSAVLLELRVQASFTLSGMTFWRSHDAWLSPMCTSKTTIRLPLLLSSTAAYTCKHSPP